MRAMVVLLALATSAGASELIVDARVGTVSPSYAGVDYGPPYPEFEFYRLPFESVERDTYGAWDGEAFHAPWSGDFEFNASLRFDAEVTIAEDVAIVVVHLFRNNSKPTNYQRPAGTDQTAIRPPLRFNKVNLRRTIHLKRGDTVRLVMIPIRYTATLSHAPHESWLQITAVR